MENDPEYRLQVDEPPRAFEGSFPSDLHELIGRDSERGEVAADFCCWGLLQEDVQSAARDFLEAAKR